MNPNLQPLSTWIGTQQSGRGSLCWPGPFGPIGQLPLPPRIARQVARMRANLGPNPPVYTYERSGGRDVLVPRLGWFQWRADHQNEWHEFRPDAKHSTWKKYVVPIR